MAALNTISQLSTNYSARLSYDDFEIAIKAFLNRIEQYSPWKLVEYRPRVDRPLQGYLSMECIIYSQTDPSQSKALDNNSSVNPLSIEDQLLLDELADHFQEITEDGEIVTADDDPTIFKISISYDYLSVKYHIVFSPSYQVPVLYFNAYRPDGVAIPLNEIYESLVPLEWRSAIRDAGLNGGISQQDHPILNVPYFYMHPCETVSLMETIQSNKSFKNEKSFLNSYIATWLSFTAQAVGITIPPDAVTDK